MEKEITKIEYDPQQAIEAASEFFKEKDLDVFEFFKKQLEGMLILLDAITKFFLYGGGAGGG